MQYFQRKDIILNFIKKSKYANFTQIENLLELSSSTIRRDLESWLALHKPFTDVVNRLKRLDNEEIDLAILTTKGEEFTSKLLSSFTLSPKLLYGHESGNKKKILVQIAKKYFIRGFVEDRRATLENIITTKELKSVPCYLASWGYLKPQDKKSLPAAIHLLELKTLATPLANWP